jgi:hypothetical protein
MRHMRSRASLGALLSAAALFAGSAVKADIIPVFNAATPTAGGCEFSYNVNVADGSRVNTGDYFTIYDFNGFIAGSAFAPVDWSITTQFTGVTPAGVDPSAFSGDSAGIINITYTYTGAATIFGPALIGGTGAFGAESTICTPSALGTYASATHKNNPGNPDDNTYQANAGSVVTPQVPETSSLMLLIPGLVPLGIMLRRRARKE